jgi:hypothetical protein
LGQHLDRGSPLDLVLGRDVLALLGFDPLQIFDLEAALLGKTAGRGCRLAGLVEGGRHGWSHLRFRPVGLALR